MKLKFTPLFTLLVTLGALPSAVLAASITWNTPAWETGNASDIITSGAFIDSAAWTRGNPVVNDVTFNGQTVFDSEGTLHFGNDSRITVTGILYPYYIARAYLPSWLNTSYLNLVSGGAIQQSGSNPSTAINLGGLSVGQSYQVQIFEAFWDYNWDTSFGGSAPLQLGVSNDPDPKKTIPNYVVGTFTADAPTQLISLASDSGVVVFDAVQVRTTSVPDSGTTAALLGTALLGLAALRRRFGCA